MDDAVDWPAIVGYCSFDWIKANATKSMLLGAACARWLATGEGLA